MGEVGCLGRGGGSRESERRGHRQPWVEEDDGWPERGEGVMEMAQRSRLVRWETAEVDSATRSPLWIGDGRRHGNW